MKYYIAAALIIIFFSLILFVFQGHTQEKYSVSGQSMVVYENRPIAAYQTISENATAEFITRRIEFESRGDRISGILMLPAGGARSAFVVLPGAGVQAGTYFQLDLARLGFAVLEIDQRGTGLTKAPAKSLDQDLVAFSNGNEPVAHKMIHDALTAADIVKSLPGIENVYIAGESMGARFAIITAAMDPDIKGVVAVSTSGYGSQGVQDQKQRQFLMSVDPDSYIKSVSPKPVVFIHGLHDPVVPIDAGRHLYSLAGEPKQFIEVNSTGHGYGTADMLGVLKEKIIGWL